MVDAVGFREFVETNSTALLRAGWLLTGDWTAAEDLVQSALLVAWPRWSALRDPNAGFAYVHTCMTRVFLRDRRRRWSGERPSERVGERVSVGDRTAEIDLRESLRAALDGLPDRQRAVVVLRYFGDLSEADTAAALGCSRGAVKSHAARALARLRTVPGLLETLTGDAS